MDLGLQPHYLSETLIESMFDIIGRYRDRVVEEHIMPKTRWRPRETTPADASHL
jgi:UDP-sulfoquinovose synthase